MTEEKLLNLIKEAAEEKNTSLDLSFKNISNLPSEIYKLNHLQ